MATKKPTPKDYDRFSGRVGIVVTKPAKPKSKTTKKGK